MSDIGVNLPAGEIQWTLDPLPNLELLPASDLLALDPGDLLMYAFELQGDLESVRAVLHAALGALMVAHTQRDRLQTRVRLLVEELRQARETLRAVSADLRAGQEFER